MAQEAGTRWVPAHRAPDEWRPATHSYVRRLVVLFARAWGTNPAEAVRLPFETSTWQWRYWLQGLKLKLGCHLVLLRFVQLHMRTILFHQVDDLALVTFRTLIAEANRKQLSGVKRRI